MNIDWVLWRIITSKIATKTEIDEHWTLMDVADANEALDIDLELNAHKGGE